MSFGKVLYDASLYRMRDLVVDDVRIGLGYTVLKNSAGGIGLAYTLRDGIGCKCSVFPRAGELRGMPLEAVSRMFSEGRDVISTAVGLAAINSVSSGLDLDVVPGDILEILDLREDDRVVMFGHFAPVEAGICKVTPHLSVFAHEVELREDSRERDRTCEILSSCSFVIMTATSLINGTFTDILERTKSARVRALLGPSTPLFPEVFRNYGIDFLSGMLIREPDRVMDIVSQGGGTMHFKKHCSKVNVRVSGRK